MCDNMGNVQPITKYLVQHYDHQHILQLLKYISARLLAQCMQNLRLLCLVTCQPRWHI